MLISGKNKKFNKIMVTAKNEDMDKIIGLELGADDYVTKPFNPQVLIARMRSVLRRLKRDEPVNTESITFDDFIIDTHLKKLFKNNTEIKLTPKEFDLIFLMAASPGQIFSRNQLLDNVWGKDFFGDTKTLDVHIRRIRNKIEKNPSNPYYVKTVWGTGYKWKVVT
ncbi:MAG: response regulator transcription factor [Clostridiales bacterium]